MSTACKITKTAYGNSTYTGYGAASSSKGYISTLRLAFTAPDTGATSFSVAITGCAGGTQGSDMSDVKLAWKITDDSSASYSSAFAEEVGYDGSCTTKWINTTTSSSGTTTVQYYTEEGYISTKQVSTSSSSGGEVMISFSATGLKLMPGKTYYIWIMPLKTCYGNTKTSSCDNLYVYCDGSYGGIVYICKDGAFAQYQCYAYIGGEWAMVQPYIYSGGSWEMY